MASSGKRNPGFLQPTTSSSQRSASPKKDPTPPVKDKIPEDDQPPDDKAVTAEHLLGSSSSEGPSTKQQPAPPHGKEPHHPAREDDWESTEDSSPAPSEHIFGLYNPKRITRKDCLDRFGSETLGLLEVMAQRASSRSATIYRKELAKIYDQFMELQTVKLQIQELVTSNLSLEDSIRQLYHWALAQYSDDGQNLSPDGETILDDLMDQLKEVYERKANIQQKRQPTSSKGPARPSDDARLQDDPHAFDNVQGPGRRNDAWRKSTGASGYVTAPGQRTLDDTELDPRSRLFVPPLRSPFDHTAPLSARSHPRFSVPGSGEDAGMKLRGGGGRGRRDADDGWNDASPEALAQAMNKLTSTLTERRPKGPSNHGKHIKPKEDIGTFSGEKTELLGFIQSVQMVVNTSGVEDSVIAKMLPVCLVDDAQSWFRGLSSSQQREMVADCESFVQGLNDEYPTQSRAEKRAAIDYHYNPKDHKSIRSYFYNKVEKMRAAEPGISEADLVEEIHRGLAPHAYPLQQSVSFRRVSLSEFKEELLDKFDVWTAKSDERRTSAKTPWLDQQKAALRAKRDASPGKDKTADKASAPNRRKIEKPSDLPNGRGCIHCDEDHWDRECTSEKAKSARKGSGGQRQKSYNVTVEVEADSSESEYEPEFTFYACSTYISKRSPPFNCSRIVPLAADVTISALPRRDIIGTGCDYLSASPLPVEVYLENDGASQPTNVTTTRV